MRAIALRSDEVMGVAGFIYPGSHVDVVVTYHVDQIPDPVTFTVLQDAEVLAVGQKDQPDPDGKPATATVVTLLLTPQDAERAVMASTQGQFHFVLRSGSDKAHVPDVPITIGQLAGLAKPHPSTNNAPRMLPVRTLPPIVVQTIAGDKQTSDTFSSGGR
jgi:pilus assembly protein CpaB